MSEPKKPIEVEVYKPDTVIKIDLPVAYVQRFNQLMLEGIPFKDQEHFAEIIKKVETGDQDDPYSYHVTTILSFLVMIEDAAREQGHLKMIEINPETQEQTDVNKD